MIYHYYIRRSAAMLFLLFQIFQVQATTHSEEAKEVATSQSIKDLKELLKAKKRIHKGKPHRDVAQALENVAEAYIKERRYWGGIAYYKKALRASIALHGKEPHAEVARAYSNVGHTYGKMNYRLDQIAYYKKALKTYRALYPDQAHVDTAATLSLIGLAYSDTSDIKEGLPYAQEAAAMFKTLHGSTPHLDVAMALYDAGVIYRRTSDPDNALLHLQQALEMYTELADGTLYERVVDVLNQIGLTYFDQKAFQEGIEYFKRVVALYQSRQDNRVYYRQAQAMNNMGTSYAALQNYAQAIIHFKEALNIYEVLFDGKPRSIIMDCLSSIAHAYSEIGNFSESLSYYKKALKVCRAVYDVGGISYESGKLTEEIAHVYGRMDNHALQISCLQEAEDMYYDLGKQRFDGPNYKFITDGNIARVNYSMGIFYRSLGDLKSSLKYFKNALHSYKILYEKYRDVQSFLKGKMLTLKMVGATYGHLGKYAQATKYYKQSLKAAYLLKDSEEHAYAHYHLGCFYHLALRSSGRKKEKKKCIHRAQDAFEAALKASDKPQADLRISYADFLIDTGQLTQAYHHLIRVIDSGDHTSVLEYAWGQQTVAPLVLQERIQQEKVVTMRAIDYAYYLLLHHYGAFLHAGVTPEKPREEYLAAYKQYFKARAEQPGKEKQNATAALLLNSL